MSDVLEALKQRRRLAQLSASDSSSQPIVDDSSAIATKTISCLAWVCDQCNKECLPIRSESRCLCGHRLKEHANASQCSKSGCTCISFFYIVAEGSWVLHCRCKHKHTDHDPQTKKCNKPKCQCSLFDSPWVCNCNHPWCDHRQTAVHRTVTDLAARIAPEVNRWDELKRGQEETLIQQEV